MTISNINVETLGDLLASMHADLLKNHNVNQLHNIWVEGNKAAISKIQVAFPELLTYERQRQKKIADANQNY